MLTKYVFGQEVTRENLVSLIMQSFSKSRNNSLYQYLFFQYIIRNNLISADLLGELRSGSFPLTSEEQETLMARFLAVSRHLTNRDEILVAPIAAAQKGDFANFIQLLLVEVQKALDSKLYQREQQIKEKLWIFDLPAKDFLERLEGWEEAERREKEKREAELRLKQKGSVSEPRSLIRDLLN